MYRGYYVAGTGTRREEYGGISEQGTQGRQIHLFCPVDP